ncbi:hypothetical protein RSSM_01006 [Rhodopirellula sallentina SM41]|uniref:Uncharacterized protein n=1 Tax=Rhodopirellula sallentina SM41 TaxID=1263870 RepID=M5U7Y6_9BACT|nr:hypothetical protein RSSM_01006 [Rhodopirellula sallentina SM41]
MDCTKTARKNQKRFQSEYVRTNNSVETDRVVSGQPRPCPRPERFRIGSFAAGASPSVRFEFGLLTNAVDRVQFDATLEFVRFARETIRWR